MANRNYPSSRIFSNHVMPVSIDGQIAIGATGAPTIAAGNGYGIASITRMAAGQYRLQLQDNFAKLLKFKASMQSPVTGSNIAATALTPGLVYQITALGTTTQANWVTAGVPSGITAAVGVTFLAAATSSGNGTAKLMGSSGIQTIELLGSNNNMLNNSPAGGFQANQGGYIDFQCMAPVVTMGAYTPAGTVASHTHSFTPAGTNSAATFTGESYTPAGTISQGIIPVTAGTAGDAVTNNAGVLESTGGQDLTVGTQTFTGTAHTLLGTNSAATFTGSAGTTGATAPAFTGTAASLTGTVAYVAADPANGSQIFFEIEISNSSVQ